MLIGDAWSWQPAVSGLAMRARTDERGGGAY